ncbi:MAG: hypothetical protein G01um10148_1073 [Parcubacteria group bacterium Gr01-1014_8]|nr:MAG: hypothetical protein G01um10148_1073 [Parcubacteria group bacterium Gr01-1014_8]
MWPLQRRIQVQEIDPDEIFLDSSNLPRLDEAQFEGRVEFPVTHMALMGVGLVFGLGAIVFLGRAFDLQILNGSEYADISRDNRLERSIIFAERGIMHDRRGVPVAWNEAPVDDSHITVATTSAYVATTTPFAFRTYIASPGFSHLVGFVRYPKQDTSGAWWREDHVGVSGLELLLDGELHGQNGSQMIETDARGNLQREHIVIPARKGQDVTISIDADVQAKLYELLSAHAANNNFQGGASVIMDVKTGELLALTSFPEYDHAAFSAGDTDAIRRANLDKRVPLLNRAVAGLYTPGSIVKPILAAGALQEKLIDPEKEILSTGQLVVPNPYDASDPTIYRDWKAHGYVDMRRAIAVSSDVYFYTIGGGFGDQKGLGIALIDTYARAFGLGAATGIPLIGEAAGVIPTPEWKKEIFGEHDPWRLGDTYITAIGQFGFQITPIQAVRYTAAIANGGNLVTPKVVMGGKVESSSVGISDDKLGIIREGMRAAVSSDAESRTARALDMPGFAISGKTGTAEVGERNQFMNSWSIGYWPSDNPRFAFATVLERAPAGTLSGAAPGMRPFFEWLAANKPEYVSAN